MPTDAPDTLVFLDSAILRGGERRGERGRAGCGGAEAGRVVSGMEKWGAERREFLKGLDTIGVKIYLYVAPLATHVR